VQRIKSVLSRELELFHYFSFVSRQPGLYQNIFGKLRYFLINRGNIIWCWGQKLFGFW